MYVMIVVAQLASGPSFATHDFQDKMTCQSMRWALEHDYKEIKMKAICLPKGPVM